MMFSVTAGAVFYVSWDYDLAANPACVGFVGRILDSAGGMVAQSAWAVDRNMRRAAFGCGKVGTFSVVVQAVDSAGKGGAMSNPVPITVVAKAENPAQPPPAPNTTLAAPTNVRLSLT